MSAAPETTDTLVVDEDDHPTLTYEADAVVGDVHPWGLAKDIQSRAGSRSDLCSVEDHAVTLAEHDGATACDLDSGELFGLFGEEEFA